MTKAGPRWIGLATGILVLSAALGMSARSQPAVERGATSNGQGQPGAAKKPGKPAANKPAKAAAGGAFDMRAPQTPQWTLEDALPSRTRPRETPAASSPGLGRVPVEGGSFGFSAETKVDPYRTPDGNRIRGHNNDRPDPSYLGLSLSVRTDDRTFLPRTILPNW